MRLTISALMLAVVGLGLIPSGVSSTLPYELYLPIIHAGPTPTPTPLPTPTSTPLPTATATLPSTATPLPTATLPSTQTPVPQTVDIRNVSDHSSYSFVYIQGEVNNNTSQAIRSAKVTVTFYNAGGQVAGSDYTYASFSEIPSGSRSAFQLLSSPASNWTRYELAITYSAPSAYTIYNRDFAIINTNAYWQSGAYYVVGEVRNDTFHTWRYVEPVVTVYNASGIVIDVDSTYVGATDLAPGQKSSFSTMFYGSHLSTMSRYEIGAEGWR